MTQTRDGVQPTESDNQGFYDADSSKYDQARWESRGGRLTNATQQRIVAGLTEMWRNCEVLEVGPGTGRFTIPLIRSGAHVTVADISAGMLETARKNIEAAGAGAGVREYRQASIYELPFEDGAFDGAMCLNVFNHLENAADALSQLARVVKPGGYVLFNHANLVSYYHMAGRRINAQNKAVGQDVYSRWERPGDVREMIRMAGLEQVKLVGHVHVPRAVDKWRMTPLVAAVDRLSRGAPLRGLAPIQFRLCRKPKA